MSTSGTAVYNPGIYEIVRDNWLLLLIGQYPNGPLGGIACTLILSVLGGFVALLMAVSPAMVEKHLRLAREALSVDTTAQAVAKAALMNLIFQRDPPAAPPLATIAAR